MKPVTEPDTGKKLPAASVRGYAPARTISALMLREMATTYGRYPGGYLWALIEPVAVIGLLSVAFSLAFHAPPLGDRFPVFYATGYLPYMMFHDISQKAALATRFSRPLLSFAPVGWIETLLARVLLNGLTHLVVFALVMTVLMQSTHHPPRMDWLGAVRALGFAFLLAIGVGCLNCFLFLSFPAWERIWTIAMRPMFLASGVIFLMEDVPYFLQDLLWYNPLFHITGLMRHATFSSYHPEYVSIAYVAGVAGLCFLMGALLLKRHHDDLIFK